MNRRDFIRRFVLTLLAIVFGPRVYQLIDHDELDAFCGFASDRWPKGQILTKELLDQLIHDIADMGILDMPDRLIVHPDRYDEAVELIGEENEALLWEPW